MNQEREIQKESSGLGRVLTILLPLTALWIWVRNLSWWPHAGDVLPVLAGFILFYILGSPWKRLRASHKGNLSFAVYGGIFAVLGIIADKTFFLALAWTLFFAIWMRGRYQIFDASVFRQLLVFILLSFPWMALDAAPLGWFFRLSGAWAVEWVMRLAGFDIVREGTRLLIQSTPVSVDEACSGLNILQAMLLTGAYVAFHFFSGRKAFWYSMVFVFFLSWLANTLRILVLSATGVFYGAETALGLFHTWGAVFVIVMMFIISWLILHAFHRVLKELK